MDAPIINEAYLQLAAASLPQTLAVPIFKAFISVTFDAYNPGPSLFNESTNTLTIPFSCNDLIYAEWFAQPTNDFLSHVRRFQQVWNVPSKVVADITCYDVGLHTATPRSISWIQYAVNGFTYEEIVLRISRPRQYSNQPNAQPSPEDLANFNIYLDLCNSLAAMVIIEELDNYGTYYTGAVFY